MTPGCADAVRGALLDAQTDIVNSDNRDLLRVAGTYGICPGMVPKYIQTTNVLSQELMIIVATHFAEYNMGAYPPSPELDFVKACKLFLDPEMESPAAKVAAFLAMADEEADCFDMMTELPPGPNGTISASDWSGVGSGPEGYYWEYLSCLWAPGTLFILFTICWKFYETHTHHLHSVLHFYSFPESRLWHVGF